MSVIQQQGIYTHWRGYRESHSRVSNPIGLGPMVPGKHESINHSHTCGIGLVHANTIKALTLAMA